MSAGSARSTAVAPSSRATATARSAVRFQTRTSLAPGLAQRVDHGPRGAAGAQHQRRGAVGRAGQRGEEARGVGVVGVDDAVGLERERVRGADGARGLARHVGDGERGLLVRDRRVDAAEAERGQRAHGLGEQVRRQRQPLVAPVQPEHGERRVVHLRRARVGHRPPAHPEPGHLTSRASSLYAGCRCSNCASVLENACSPDLLGLAHEEQVRLLGGLGGGLERGEAGVADRRRRQPAVQARVVRLVLVDLGLLEPALSSCWVVPDRRVDPQRHSLLEPVVDHGRDERALLRDLHLALDHRGDDQHVVARQVLLLRVAHVDVLEVLLERVELLLDQLVRGRALGQRVGGGEQEALGGLGALGRAEAADRA